MSDSNDSSDCDDTSILVSGIREHAKQDGAESEKWAKLEGWKSARVVPAVRPGDAPKTDSKPARKRDPKAEAADELAWAEANAEEHGTPTLPR